MDPEPQYGLSSEMWEEAAAIGKRILSEMTTENLLVNFIAREAAFAVFQHPDGSSCWPCLHKGHEITLPLHSTWEECEESTREHIDGLMGEIY